MGRGNGLSQLQQYVLLCLIRLGDEAYGVPIHQEIEERTGAIGLHRHRLHGVGSPGTGRAHHLVPVPSASGARRTGQTALPALGRGRHGSPAGPPGPRQHVGGRRAEGSDGIVTAPLSDGALPRPPRFWRALLRFVATEADRAYLLDDLEERFRRRGRAGWSPHRPSLVPRARTSLSGSPGQTPTGRSRNCAPGCSWRHRRNHHDRHHPQPPAA